MIDYDPRRWRQTLFGLRGAMLSQVLFRVLVCTLWACSVVSWHHHIAPIGLSDKAHVLIGLAMGLLLVFRNNAAYDRYWEGRKQWGSIANELRNLGRASSVWLVGAPDLARRLLSWAAVYPYAVMHSLRGDRRLGPSSGLSYRAIQQVMNAEHIPLAVARRMSATLAAARKRGTISESIQMALDRHVLGLVDCLGTCERIQRSTLPFAYVAHLRRMLVLYCYTLPFTLVDLFGWGAVVVTMLLSYTLFGIEAIGVELEAPFGRDPNDLPLERYCRVISQELRSFRRHLPALANPSAMHLLRPEDDSQQAA